MRIVYQLRRVYVTSATKQTWPRILHKGIIINVPPETVQFGHIVKIKGPGRTMEEKRKCECKLLDAHQQMHGPERKQKNSRRENVNSYNRSSFLFGMCC